MKTLTALIALCALAPFAFAQETNNANIGVSTSATGLVSVSSKGRDVRDVIYDLFHQSKKNFVIVGETRANLYLNLEGVAFDNALRIILKQTGLGARVEGEVTYIGKDLPQWSQGSPGKEANVPAASATKQPMAGPDMSKSINVKLTKVTFKDLLKELTSQTGIDFVIARDVKEFKLDAELKDKSLKYTLDLITKQAGLQYYALNSGTILVEHKVN